MLFSKSPAKICIEIGEAVGLLVRKIRNCILVIKADFPFQSKYLDINGSKTADVHNNIEQEERGF
jgi:hypothetical protein